MEPLVAEIERRFAELEAQLGDPAVMADQRRYAAVAREHKRLSGAADWHGAGASAPPRWPTRRS